MIRCGHCKGYRVLDKKKLEANIASGDVDPIAVAECTTETPNKPYVKLTS